MQAIIVTGGKQYNVKEGDVIYIEKLAAEAEQTVTFDQVLAVVDGADSKFGTPTVCAQLFPQPSSLRSARSMMCSASMRKPG